MFKKCLAVLLIAFLVSASPASATLATGVYHQAEDITPGTFSSGNFVFPNQLNVSQNFYVDTDTLVVDSSNNRVGIGTTPITDLDVGSGSIHADRIYLGNGGNPLIAWNTGGIAENGFHIGFDGTEPNKQLNFVESGIATRMTILRGGNIGIGTTSPTAKLDVRGDVNIPFHRISFNAGTNTGTAGIASTDQAYIYGEHDENTENSRLVIQMRDNTNDAIILRTSANATGANIDMVKVANNVLLAPTFGNVGIGTTSPGSLLDVAGTAQANYLQIDAQDGTNEGGELRLAGAGSYGSLQLDNYQGDFRVHTLAAGKKMRIVGGDLLVDNELMANGAGVNYVQGSLAVGTTDPGAYKLYVNGDAYIAGMTITNGSLAYNGNLDMQNNIVTNIGNANTDFTSSGGLNLAGDLDVDSENFAVADDFKIKSLKNNAGSLGQRWYRIGRIQNQNPIAGGEKSQIMGRAYVQTDFGTAGDKQSIIDFSFGSRGTTLKPVLTIHGDAFPDGSNDRAEFEIWKDASNWHYLFFKQPEYSEFATFEYAFVNGVEEWIVDDPSDNAGWTKVWDSQTDAVQEMYIGTGKVVHENAAGNIGIGTNSPSTQLHLVGGGSSGGTTLTMGNLSIGGVKLTNSGTNGQDFTINMDPNGLTSGENFDVQINGGTVFTIANPGNVGIGTTNPQNTVHVESSAGPVIRLQRTGYSDYLKLEGGGASTRIGSAGGAAPLLFVINDVEKARFDANGNLGIGQSSPQAKLDILSNGGTDILVSYAGSPVLNLSQGSQPVLRLGAGTEIFDNAINGGINVLGTKPLLFLTGSGQERMRIIQNGNVGIGTTSPSRKLEVSGGYLKVDSSGTFPTSATDNALLLGLDVATGLAHVGTTTGGTTRLVFSTTSSGTTSEKMRISETGNVGIGDSTPDAKLDVEGEVRISSGNFLTFGFDDATSRDFGLRAEGENLFIREPEDSNKFYMGFYDDTRVGVGVGTEVLSVTGTNVGIGTSGPSSKLDVRGIGTNGGGGVTGLLLAHTGSTGGDGAGIEFTYGNAGVGGNQNIARIMPYTQGGGGGDILFQTAPSASGAYTTKMILERDGDVGIGTANPGSLLHLSANGGDTPQLRLTNIAGGSSWYISQRTTGLNFAELSAADGRLFLENGGNIGVGNLDPSYKLDVSGNARISDGDDTLTLDGGGSTSEIVYTSTTTGSDWQVGTGWSGSTFGTDAFYFYNNGERASINDDGSAYFAGAVTSTGLTISSGTVALPANQIDSSEVNFNYAAASSKGGPALNLEREDNRVISPNELTAGQLKFGFTSWNNNNGGPYADFLHMRSYTDSSGGNDNLVMLRKDGTIGMRLWTQSFGSGTAYSSYKDVALEGNAVTFSTVNTGPGATEVHLMNQNLRTSDAPSFAGLTSTSTLSMSNNRITNLATPTASTDAATKGYVDSKSGSAIYAEPTMWPGGIPSGSTSDWSGSGLSVTTADTYTTWLEQSGCCGGNTVSARYTGTASSVFAPGQTNPVSGATITKTTFEFIGKFARRSDSGGAAYFGLSDTSGSIKFAIGGYSYTSGTNWVTYSPVSGYQATGTGFDNSWHTFRIEVTSSTVTFFIDNTQVGSYSNNFVSGMQPYIYARTDDNNNQYGQSFVRQWKVWYV